MKRRYTQEMACWMKSIVDDLFPLRELFEFQWATNQIAGFEKFQTKLQYAVELRFYIESDELTLLALEM